MTSISLDEWFDHHPPTPNRIIQHETVRAGAKRYAAELLLAVPFGPERDKALEHLRAAAMWANAGIAMWSEPGEEQEGRPQHIAGPGGPHCPACAADEQHGHAEAGTP